MSAPVIKPVTAWALVIDGAILPITAMRRMLLKTEAVRLFKTPWKKLHDMGYRVARVTIAPKEVKS